MIEIPPKFAGRPPVNPESRSEKTVVAKTWRGAQGLAVDVRYYGRWMRDEAEKRIGHLYPSAEITPAMVRDRPDLEPYQGRKLTVIAWLWARTVKSPNPAFADVDVPLASTFVLSTKRGREAYVEPVIKGRGYTFEVKLGVSPNLEAAKAGTKRSRGANFRCLMSGSPISGDYIKAEGQAKRMGARLTAVVATGNRERIYLSPNRQHEEEAATIVVPDWHPDGDVPARLTGGTCVPYGLTTWGDLFTPRQLVALTTFSELLGEAAERARRDATAAGLPDDERPLRESGTGATAYAEAVAVFLSLGISRLADAQNSLCQWGPDATQTQHLFRRQAIPMVWDYAESNLFSRAAGDLTTSIGSMCRVLEQLVVGPSGSSENSEAQSQRLSIDAVVSTDPPYYDNIGYADLSDFFYIWIRHCLKPVFPALFATLAVPKIKELVASPHRHGSRDAAHAFFLAGMTQALCRLQEQAHPAFPVTVYYAFKQSEKIGDAGAASRRMGDVSGRRVSVRVCDHRYVADAHGAEREACQDRRQRSCFQHRSCLSSSGGRRGHCLPPCIPLGAAIRAAVGARRSPDEQPCAGRPRTGGDRSWHGGLHALQPSPGGRRFADVSTVGARRNQQNAGRDTNEAGRRA